MFLAALTRSNGKTVYLEKIKYNIYSTFGILHLVSIISFGFICVTYVPYCIHVIEEQLSVKMDY